MKVNDNVKIEDLSIEDLSDINLKINLLINEIEKLEVEEEKHGKE